MEEKKTIEQQVADVLLERETAEIEINGKKYSIAPPSIATLVLVSEIISQMPTIPSETDPERIVYHVLHHAKDFDKIGEMVAVLILGAKNITEEVTEEVTETRFFGLWKTKKTETKVINRKYQLAKEIMESMSPAEVYDIFIKRLGALEISSFFGLTTSLNEVNVLKSTKEVEV